MKVPAELLDRERQGVSIRLMADGTQAHIRGVTACSVCHRWDRPYLSLVNDLPVCTLCLGHAVVTEAPTFRQELKGEWIEPSPRREWTVECYPGFAFAIVAFGLIPVWPLLWPQFSVMGLMAVFAQLAVNEAHRGR